VPKGDVTLRGTDLIEIVMLREMFRVAIQTKLHRLPTNGVPPETNSNALAQLPCPQGDRHFKFRTFEHISNAAGDDTRTFRHHSDVTGDDLQAFGYLVKPSQVLSASSETHKDSDVSRTRPGIPMYWFANIKCLNARETELKNTFRNFGSIQEM
jgi:hypothetical protein